MVKEAAKRWLIQEIIDMTDEIMTFKDHEGHAIILDSFASCDLETDMVLPDLPIDDLVNLAAHLSFNLDLICQEFGIEGTSLIVRDVDYPPVKH